MSPCSSQKSAPKAGLLETTALRTLAPTGSDLQDGFMEAIGEDEQRRHWRLVWLSAIQAFADHDTQKRRWTDPRERNPAYSFVECMCGYFDDAYMCEDDAFERRISSGRLTREEANAVTEFHVVAEAYRSPNGDDYDAKAILADPAWQNVVAMAQSSQNRLMDLLSDQCEVEALFRPLDWFEESGTFYQAKTGSFIVPDATSRSKTLARFVGAQFRKLWNG